MHVNVKDSDNMHMLLFQGYGENLFFMSGGEVTCFDAVQAWYDEIKDYSYSTTKATTPGKPIGHFTQVVWKASTTIGVGISKSADGGIFVCARYKKQGNFVMMNYGESYTSARKRAYGANVLPLKNAGDAESFIEKIMRKRK